MECRFDVESCCKGAAQVIGGLQAKEAEPIYECCWYPLMNIQDPATCCFLTSSRDHPVHLWDSNTGEVRYLRFKNAAYIV